MFVELEIEDRAAVRKLFAGYPCCHGMIAAALEGSMGKAFADAREHPCVALITLSFQFLAGDPLHENAVPLLKLLQPGSTGGQVICPTPAWHHRITTTYANQFEIIRREAFRAEQFDLDRLRAFSRTLPGGFELRRVRRGEVEQFAADLSPALVSDFGSPEAFIARGIGLGVWHQGRFVSGASSANVGGGKAEFEIQTQPEFRRQGLARAVAAALILYCLEHGLEPCWDAANEASSALARQLGFHSTGKYDAYWLKPTIFAENNPNL